MGSALWCLALAQPVAQQVQNLLTHERCGQVVVHSSVQADGFVVGQGIGGQGQDRSGALLQGDFVVANALAAVMPSISGIWMAMRMVSEYMV